MAAKQLLASALAELRLSAVAPRSAAERAHDALPLYLHAVAARETPRAAAVIATLEGTLKAQRIHSELLARYNPTYGSSEAERIRATANMVGWDVPVEYVTPAGADAAGDAAMQQGWEEREASRRKVEARKERYEGVQESWGKK
ncbi:hypothetical protein FA09DRAFT_337721 [Tilletiopsis washingtonensis]|uniref:Uncharacterized protein n=1 Tax=Tilletiopsis washingtonensis TaxID=58919 RepID=A0A316ZBU9_9BASI|nr:hypothetical protein FA09DRAFT_337721 [Tilletiopsis washingtonensis]PWN98999.1 hypothetical protein FA09DRAFT_337721 [Tilletiopsis washingtonensis]